MKCPYCSSENSRVVDSREAGEKSIRRRRECLGCGKRFTTYETVELLPLLVIKRDGRRQTFDRNKILQGMLRACEKRPVSLADLETIATEIEGQLQGQLDNEIESRAIGELVMERLRHLDQVAFVRFASVYREFKDVSSFMTEIQRLVERT